MDGGRLAGAVRRAPAPFRAARVHRSDAAPHGMGPGQAVPQAHGRSAPAPAPAAGGSMTSELDFGPFLSLSEGARASLAARARSLRVARSQHLLRVGDDSDSAIVILAGRVRVTSEDGTLLSTMSPPGLVGEIAVLEGRKRSADVVALEPVRALRIDAADLRAIVKEQPDFARTLQVFADARGAN